MRALNLGEKMKIYLPSADVLHKLSNVAISRCCFADDGKETDKSEKRTCRACKDSVYVQICKVVTFLLPSPLSFLELPSIQQQPNRSNIFCL